MRNISLYLMTTTHCWFLAQYSLTGLADMLAYYQNFLVFLKNSIQTNWSKSKANIDLNEEYLHLLNFVWD